MCTSSIEALFLEIYSGYSYRGFFRCLGALHSPYVSNCLVHLSEVMVIGKLIKATKVARPSLSP